jgi:dolichol-phosphate mannosyltransferase
VKLAVIVPVFNEAATIAEVVGRIRAVPMDKEIIVVDDASTDGTDRVLAGLSGPDLTVLRHGANQGKGAAIRTAIPRVTAGAAVIQDADLEYGPEQLPALLKPIEEGKATVVFGSRFAGTVTGMRLANYVANKLLAWTASLLFGQRITDEATCYKMFRTETLRSLPLECRRFEFCPEVIGRIRRRGIPIMELPIEYRGRTVAAGKKIRLKDSWDAFAELVRMRLTSKP